MTSTADPVSDDLSAQAQFLHDVVARWLAQPGVTIACGRWADGAISEIIPRGAAHLLPSLYDGCFAGVRELRLTGQPHHLHIDFGRVHKLAYVVAPSVCLAFKPSFELRLLSVGPGGAPTDRWLVSLMLESPYIDGQLDPDAALRFFQQACDDATRRPDLVELNVDPSVRASSIGPQVLTALCQATGCSGDWEQALSALAPAAAPKPWLDDPPMLPLLRDALALRDASLVIFRDRTLIEFKTERLDGVHRYEEAGHVSWQIGDQHDHHCHLSLGVVTRVLFSAEPGRRLELHRLVPERECLRQSVSPGRLLLHRAEPPLQRQRAAAGRDRPGVGAVPAFPARRLGGGGRHLPARASRRPAPSPPGNDHRPCLGLAATTPSASSSRCAV